MAKYFNVGSNTFADDFKAALESYQGDGVTIESASGNTVVFRCPAVCDKVLKILCAASGTRAYIGDSSSSMVQFSNSYDGATEGLHVILSESFILIDTQATGGKRNSSLMARLSNGRYMVVVGLLDNETYDGYLGNNKGCFTYDMVLRPIRMVTPYATNAKSNGKMCLFPSYVLDNDEVELNADGTFADIPGLWLTATRGAPVVGSNYYLSQSGLRGLSSEGQYCYTQKYVELEKE